MNTVTEVTPAPRSAPVAATWICLGLAWLLFVVPVPGAGLFVGWPLNLVAFILAIVVMSRGRTAAGLVPLIMSLVISPVVYFIGLAIFAVALSSGAAYGDYVEREKAATAAQADAVAHPDAAGWQEVIDVDARTLYLAYDANEVAADQLYKGNRLAVSGTVGSIDRDFLDQIYVQRDVGELFMGVQANGLPEHVAASLHKGQQITAECTGAGLMVGSPILDDCELR